MKRCAIECFMYGSSEKKHFLEKLVRDPMPGGSCICRIFNVISAMIIFVTNKNKLNYFDGSNFGAILIYLIDQQ